MEIIGNFLSNQPIGKDLLDGQSQDRVAEAIKQHILNEDKVSETESKRIPLPRIIGVEGSWGSGKSNMLLQLQDKLQGKYHFYTYDAWGNQEDLQRRSILELLTDDLINNQLLTEPTKYKVISSDLGHFETKNCTWKDRLFTLIARKSATHNVTIPKIESSTKWFAMALVVSGLVAAIVSSVEFVEHPLLNFLILLFVTSIPMLGFCVFRWRKYKQQCQNVEGVTGWAWKEMWKMYQTEGTQDTTTYTISELEPTVFEFREWMTDLENALINEMRLIIVFDNMDRLPREKVRQLWSSIQTFFAGNGYNKVWCVIPFDRKHLANAFADDVEEDKEKLTNYFVEKTFPVVYRIPDPIVTDYKGVFEYLFTDAFGKREDQVVINRCYRLKHPVPNMREMISFINKCVSLEHTWGDSIRLSSIALFVLNNDVIFNADQIPEEVIVNKQYMDKAYGVIEMDDDLPIEISALVYGVAKEDAAQLPLKYMMHSALASTEPSRFDEFSKEQKSFYSILEDEIAGLDPTFLNNAVHHLSKIDREGATGENLSILNKAWDSLGEMYLSNKQNEREFRIEIRLLMDHCTSTDLKEKIADRFLAQFVSGEKNDHKGGEWYQVYKDVAAFVQERGLHVVLPTKELKSDSYLAYVREAKEAYKKYPVVCNVKDFVDSIITWMKEGSLDLYVLKLLKTDKGMDFSRLLTSAKEMVESDQATNENIANVLDVCKELTYEPLNLKTNLTFLNSLKLTSGVRCDLILLRVLHGSDEEMTNEEINHITDIAGKYISTQGLLDKTMSLHTASLNKIMKAIIEKGVHTGKPAGVKNMLGQLTNICSFTQASKEAVLKFINDWGITELTPEEQELNMVSTFNEEWIKVLESDKHAYSKAILVKYYADFAKQDVGQFFNPQNQWNLNSYWRKMLKVMIDDPDFKATKPANMKDIVRKLIQAICSGSIVAGNEDADLHKKLLEWVDFSEVSSVVLDEVNKFSTGNIKMNEFKFMTLRHYFERLENSEEKILNYILLPIIKSEKVQKVIVQNSGFYEPLLKVHLVHASSLKDTLIKIHDDEGAANAEFKALIERLNIIEKKLEHEGQGVLDSANK